MLVEAAIGPIHSAALGLLVGHNPQRGTRPPTRPQHLAAVHVLRSPCGAALSVLVEAALGPAVVAVLVEAALGPIHSAAPVETALGPIHDAVLRRSPSPALPVEPMRSATRLARHPTCRPRQRWLTRRSARHPGRALRSP